MQQAKPSWDQVFKSGIGLADAAVVMGCSKRTAASELASAQRRASDAAFRYRHAGKLAWLEARPGTEISNWPIALQELALRIAREGGAAVARERAAMASALPRGIAIRR